MQCVWGNSLINNCLYYVKYILDTRFAPSIVKREDTRDILGIKYIA